ncbi:glycosyltransferase family 4 protein [Anaerolineales bacterium]
MSVPILFVSWYVGLGGGETDLLSLAHQLQQNTSYKCHLMLPYEGQLSSQWRSMGLPVHIVPFRGASTWFIPGLWKYSRVVKEIGKLMDRHHIEIVHSDYHSLPFALPAAKARQKPLLWTCMGWWFKPKPWQKSFFQQVDAIFAHSKAIRDGFLGDPPFMPPSRIPVVYSGVDTLRFHPDKNQKIRQEFNIDKNAPLILMVARFQDIKGHDRFQEIILKLALEFPDLRAIVVGEDIHAVKTDADYKAKIMKQYAADPILQKHLIYAGFRQDVEYFMASADVLVCPSDFESFGRVNIEAMACETVVVSTNQGGPLETISNGESGYLLNPHDIDGFTKRIANLLQHPEKRLAMAKAARYRVEALFSAQASAEAYQEVFARWIHK